MTISSLSYITMLCFLIWSSSGDASDSTQRFYQHHGKEETLASTLLGDIMLGGLFPMHEDGSAEMRHCGDLKTGRGIQRLEAMFFAIDKINRNATLLPSVTLGVTALDTCSQDTHALEQTLEFVKFSVSTNNAAQYTCPSGKPEYHPPKPIAIVIGAASSQVSVMVANVLRLFRIPQISYSSTSTELSDKARFEYFARVVPSDNFQVEAMVDIVASFGWSWVSGIADEGNYGESAMETFKKLAGGKKICIHHHEKIRRTYQQRDFDAMITRLNFTKNTKNRMGPRGVIMFVNEDNVVKVRNINSIYM